MTSWQIPVWLTEDASPPLGQAEAVDGHIVNWDSGQREGAASPCIPGVWIQRQTHDEETNHCEGDRDGQGHLWVIERSKIWQCLGQGIVQKDKKNCKKYVLQFSTITTDTLTLKGLGWRGKRYRWMSIPKVAKAMKNQRAKEAKLMSW